METEKRGILLIFNLKLNEENINKKNGKSELWLLNNDLVLFNNRILVIVHNFGRNI